MTRVVLLDDLKSFCEDVVREMELPTKPQKGDIKQIIRPPDLYKMRLTDSKSYEKLSPYIILQWIKSSHRRDPENHNQLVYTAEVRFVFSVYCENEQDGAIMLLNLMDRVQEKLLKSIRIGKTFLLDENAPLEAVYYNTDSAPFYGGEMVGTFKLIPIEREVDLFAKGKK